MDGGNPVPLDLRPSFQVDPSLFPSLPVDRIRLVATDAETRLAVGSSDVAVSSTADQWTLSLGVDLGGAPSRVVMVEVELLAGQAVQWSGRLGPITVQAGATAQALGVDLHRGTLDNLDVTSLAIGGAPTQLDVGATSVLIANLTLVPGSTASPTVFWASTNTAVATVTAEGPIAAVTGVAVGTVDIVAVAGAADAEVTIEVRTIAPPGFDVEWRGVTADWATASNWSTGLVPQPTDDVYIPPSTIDPTITSPADVTVASLTVASGANLTANNTTLTVAGSLDATGPIGGSAIVVMTGSSVGVRGTIQTQLRVSGTVVAAAASSLAVSDLTITGPGASFDLNGRSATVATLVTTLDGGVLRMTAGGGALTTLNATFAGGSTAGLLTDGALHVRGDFVVTDVEAFGATGSHTVVFEGTADQSVGFSNPSAGQQGFANVTFDNPRAVSFSSDFVVTGTLSVLDGAVVADDFTVRLAGALVDPTGRLSFAGLTLIGDVTALPATLAGSVTVISPVTWPNSVAVLGGLSLFSSLNVGSNTLSVTDDVFSNTALTVPAGGVLTIGGILELQSGSTFDVNGTVTAVGGCFSTGATITGSGTHPCGGPPPGTKTWVGGDPSGPNDWLVANNWSPPGVPGAADDVVIVGDVVQASPNAEVASLLLGGGAALDLGGSTLTVTGDLNALGGSVFNGLVRMGGAGSVLQGYVDALEVTASRALSGTVTANGNVTVIDAELDVGSQVILIGGDLTITGALARLAMTQAGASVLAAGSVVFDGGDHTGLLTNGVLSVGGDFTVTDRSPTGFVASGNHYLELLANGTSLVSFAVPGQQAISQLYVGSSGATTFITDAAVSGNAVVAGVWSVPANVTVTIGGQLQLYPGSTLDVNGTVTAVESCLNLGGQITGTGEHPCPPPIPADRTWIGGDAAGGATAWENLLNWLPAGVPTASESVLIPYSLNPPLLTSTQSVGALYVDFSGSLDLGGNTLAVAGDLAVDGFVFNGLIDLVGSGQELRGTVASVRVSTARALSDYLYIDGDLDVRALLDFDVGGAYVTGNLDVTTALGAIAMSASDNSLVVAGNATFNGASTSGLLSDGNISVYGDFTVLDEFSAQAFLSAGTEVYLAGDDQTVTFSDPGPGTQSFFDLYLSSTSGAVVLASDVLVTNTFLSSIATLRRAASTLSVLRVTGSLSVFQTTFDGLPVRLVSAVSPNGHALIDASFVNMPTDVAQLYVELDGAGTAGAFVIETPIFNTPPGPNGVYLQAVNTSVSGVQLVVQVTTPTPGTVLPSQVSAGTLTSIVWPYP
jgi:hypothetical protein